MLNILQFNLAWKLALVVKGHASPALLESYTAERLPVIAEMLNVTKLMLKVTLDVNAGKPWQRGEHLLQLGVNYRGSAIIVDESQSQQGADAVQATGNSYNVDETLRSGDRAPDAPGLLDMRSPNGLTVARLFDIFKPYIHTVLIFSSAAPNSQCAAVLEALKQYPEGLIQSAIVHTWEVYSNSNSGWELATMVLKDNLGHAYEGYQVVPRAEGITVYIIRPDGHVGGLVQGVEGVKKYFGGIF